MSQIETSRPEPVDLLVRADFLYPMSEGLPIIQGGEVAVRAGRVLYAGPRHPDGSWQATEVIEGRGKAVLPGLVNCHNHAASLIFRSQTDGKSTVGLYKVAFRMEREITEDSWSLTGMVGCIDMIRSGITTMNDIWYNPDGLARAVEATGLRAFIANKVFDVKLENLMYDDYTRYPEIGEARLRDGVRFAEEWHGRTGGRIMARMGTHATDTCERGLHIEARREADRLGIGMHIHAAQSEREQTHIATNHGMGPLEYLRDIGLLREDVVCAHLLQVGPGDLAAMVETGAGYACCPGLYPRHGIFPDLQGMIDAGLNTGFGTDWMNNDPFDTMRSAMNVLRVNHRNDQVMPADQALWYQTMGSAKVLGLDHEIGSLEAGKKADLIMIDLERSHLQPYYGEYSALLYYAKSSDVITSVVDGQVVMREGRILGVDEGAVMRQISQALPGWAARLHSYGGNIAGGEEFGCPCCGP